MNPIPIDREAPWRLLGLAVRAGQVATGAEATLQAIRKGKARLILIAEDAAGNMRQKMLTLARTAHIPVRVLGQKSDIGHWTGHDDRAVAAIGHAGLARRIEELIDLLDSQADVTRPNE
jgi:ribosomal protein L7Ae-like RNA K-turn-binding protein